MNRHSFLIAGSALLAIGFTAVTASAQCAFEHPRKTHKLQSGLVQAFVSCGNAGGNAPNATTQGGVPSCKPPETFNQQAGSPANGWLWDEQRSTGYVQFAPAQNKISSPLNLPTAADLAVRMNLNHILDANGKASGTGTLATVARATFDDRTGGDMTVVDFPAGFPFTLTSGKASLRTSANALLNGIGQPGLPYCASIEVVSVNVIDENGNAFANLGTFLPRPW